MIEVERHSELPVPAPVAWRWATTPETINSEFWPLLRMTMPPRLRGRDLSEFPVGEPLGRSRLLLFGVLPVDYDDLCIAELEPPRRFLERSRTLSFDPWVHERTIEPTTAGCLLSDRLSFELKSPLRYLPGAALISRAIVAGLFGHRHRRLRRRGAAAAR